jgi:hypothetical protein
MTTIGTLLGAFYAVRIIPLDPIKGRFGLGRQPLIALEIGGKIKIHNRSSFECFT